MRTLVALEALGLLGKQGDLGVLKCLSALGPWGIAFGTLGSGDTGMDRGALGG